MDELGNRLYVLGIMDEIGFRGMFGSQVGGSNGVCKLEHHRVV